MNKTIHEPLSGAPRSAAFTLLAVAALLVATSPTALGKIYNVGPGQPLATPNDVPWESLKAGDTVRIHWRKEPYHNKWVICRQGTKEMPIIVEGVRGPNGELPVIDGENATTRKQLDFWSEQRSLIKIGGASRPKDTTPKHIWIRHLEIRNSRPPFTYTGKNKSGVYQFQSAGVYVEKGEHIRISHCHIHNNGNGVMSSWFSRFLSVEYCRIHSNGIERNGLAHNCYIDGVGALFQYNHFGPQRPNCWGVNFKSRAARTILRYNWIEGGKRCVNLPESRQQHVYDDPGYHDCYVYGNVLIREDRARNNQILHYGVEPGFERWARKGTLHFYNNTVIANRTRSTTLFTITSDDATVECRNNIIYRPPQSGRFGILSQGGRIKLRNNWISKTAHLNSSRIAIVLENSGNIKGVNPGFQNFDQHDFRLTANSACIDAAGKLTAVVIPDHVIDAQYLVHQRGEPRPDAGPSNHATDLGAFGFKKAETQTTNAND